MKSSADRSPQTAPADNAARRSRGSSGTFDRADYLRRIRYEGSLEPNAATLAALQKAHLEAVPFENLDVYLRRGVGLDPVANYDKIVRGGRGGWCFELNGLFASLLSDLGFDVTLLSMAVAGSADLGLDFDHLALLVHLERLWLADVGFGDSTLYPLALDDPDVQDGGARNYRVEVGDFRLTTYEDGDDGWAPAYSGTFTPRRIEEFARASDRLQTSPESPFHQKPFCTQATPDGRITLLRNRLKTTVNGETREEAVAEDVWDDTLHRVFGIRLP